MEIEESNDVLFDRLGGKAGLMKLLTHFYADVRQHQLIGPIFMGKIQDWPAHMEIIASFWAGLTGGPAMYRGGFAMRHFSLKLEEAHFNAWLTLWKNNCAAQLAPREAGEMMELANRIAGKLRQILGVPAAEAGDSIQGNKND